MKAILMSIQARHNRNIEEGKKISELRNRIPQCVYPIKVYTYESGKDGRHKIVNEWVCESVDTWNLKRGIPAHLMKAACVSVAEIREYRDKKHNSISEMHISDLKIYDKPKELSEFKKVCPMKNSDCAKCEFYSDYSGSCTNWVTHAPQSWQYVEKLQ